MEENKLVEKPNPTKIATKWAVIDVLTGIIITYGIELLNVDQTSPIKYLGFVPFIIFLFLKKSYAATPMYVSSRRYSATHEAITIQIPAS